MKQLLVVVAGTIIAFAILVAIGIGIMWHGENTAREDLKEGADYKDPCTSKPPGLSLAQHNQVLGVDQVAIFGIVENASDIEWRDVTVKAEIGGPNAVTNECETQLYGPIPPRAKRPFLVQCTKTSLSGQSPSVEYKIGVSTACRATG